MIEVCLQRATVQIPGAQKSMNQSQESEAATFSLSFSHTDDNNPERRVCRPSMGIFHRLDELQFPSVVHYCEL